MEQVDLPPQSKTFRLPSVYAAEIHYLDHARLTVLHADIKSTAFPLLNLHNPREFLKVLRSLAPEVVVIQKCNSIDLVAASLNEDVDRALAKIWQEHSLGNIPPHGNVVTLRDKEALAYLFRTAASLESIVIGDNQVYAQMRRAWVMGRELHAVGPILEAVWICLRDIARFSYLQTDIHRGNKSVAKAAAEWVASCADRQDLHFVVVGSDSWFSKVMAHELRHRQWNTVHLNPEDALRTPSGEGNCILVLCCPHPHLDELIKITRPLLICDLCMPPPLGAAQSNVLTLAMLASRANTQALPRQSELVKKVTDKIASFERLIRYRRCRVAHSLACAILYWDYGLKVSKRDMATIRKHLSVHLNHAEPPDAFRAHVAALICGLTLKKASSNQELAESTISPKEFANGEC